MKNCMTFTSCTRLKPPTPRVVMMFRSERHMASETDCFALHNIRPASWYIWLQS